MNGVATVGDRDRVPDRFDAAYFVAGTFELLGIAPSMGRLPPAADDRPGNQAVALLGAEAWRLRYANDPQILGRTILVNGAPVTVIGIVPDRSGFPSTANVWMPLGQWPDWKEDRAVRSLSVVGRLRDDVSVEEARSEIETIYGRFESAYPDTNRNLRARVVTLKERLLGTLDGWRQFIMAGVIVILVACANVANLMMARALNRAPEIAIRTSLGASRGAIDRATADRGHRDRRRRRRHRRARVARRCARHRRRHSRRHPAVLGRLHDGRGRYSRRSSASRWSRSSSSDWCRHSTRHARM